MIEKLTPTKVLTRVYRYLQPFNGFFIKRISGRRPICPNVGDWALSRGGHEVASRLGSQVINRKMPLTVETEVDEAYTKRTRYEFPKQYYVSIPNARLVGENAMVVLPDNTYVEELAWHKAHLQTDPGYWTPIYPPKKRQTGSYYSIATLWWQNYAHWVKNSMPRLYFAMDWLPQDAKLIVPYNLERFHREWLALLGIEEARIVRFNHLRTWELELLHFSPPVGLTGNVHPKIHKSFRNSVWNRVGVTSPEGTERIYLSRRLAKYRQLLNEDEVEACLGSYGFKTYMPETMSVPDQIRLFSRAEAVVSIHGAGLANLIFAPSGTKVLEMHQPPPKLRVAMWFLCETMEHTYAYIVGDKVRVGLLDEYDIRVNIDKLRTGLSLLGITSS
jgi:hypothetical protein